MTPKMGRPKLEKTKDGFVGVRLDQETIDKLDAAAKAKETTRSEIVREGIQIVFESTKK